MRKKKLVALWAMSHMERTLGLIKPDAMEAGLAGRILDDILQAGFRLVALRLLTLSRAQAEAFYAAHQSKPFFESLVRFMTSGPVIAFVLEKDGAIETYRTLMGATNPAQAAPDTLRAKYAQSIERNAVHGSDSPEAAAREIAFFFPACELSAVTAYSHV